MSEPTCRTCWLKTLPESERDRIAAEPITSCVYLCPEHMDALNAMMPDWSAVFIRTDRPAAAFALSPASTPDDAEGKG